MQTDTVAFLGRAGKLAGEPKVIGFIAGAKKGAKKQIVGDRSVVVVKVGDKIDSKMAAAPKQMLTQQAMSMMGLNQGITHTHTHSLLEPGTWSVPTQC